MAEEKTNQQPEMDLSEQRKVRREKLAALQAAGQDPFQQTHFDCTATSAQIKAHFDEMEGQSVRVAGRLMSKRGMGKVSFCDLQDRDGRIQLYARQDEMDEAVYKQFKKYDIGDIVGVDGEVFRTQRGEMSVRAKALLCSPSPCCLCRRSSTACRTGSCATASGMWISLSIPM